jgi:rsbT co-antagonist protein RsbR
MNETNKTPGQLAQELSQARARIAELEAEEAQGKRAERQLRQQSTLLQGVAGAAGHLLTNLDETTAINETLGTLGAVTGVDRIYIFENHPHPASGALAVSRRFEWCAGSVEPEIDNPALQNVPYLPFWYDRLAVGEAVNCLTRDFPPDIRRALEAQNILSLLAVPINIDGEFWGYIGFDNCHTEHQWSPNEQAVLTVAASIIGGTIGRKKLEAEQVRLQQEIIEAQKQALQELSTPVIPILDRILVMPLIGSIDTLRARNITRALLAKIREHQARVLILDITGVPLVDSGVAAHLNKTIQAARLKGTQTIITGISESVAETIVDLGIDWSGIETLRDLQTGLLAALDKLGIKLSQ